MNEGARQANADIQRHHLEYRLERIERLLVTIAANTEFLRILAGAPTYSQRRVEPVPEETRFEARMEGHWCMDDETCRACPELKDCQAVWEEMAKRQGGGGRAKESG